MFDSAHPASNVYNANTIGGCAAGVACQPIGVSPTIVRNTNGDFDVIVATGGADWDARGDRQGRPDGDDQPVVPDRLRRHHADAVPAVGAQARRHPAADVGGRRQLGRQRQPGAAVAARLRAAHRRRQRPLRQRHVDLDRQHAAAPAAADDARHLRQRACVEQHQQHQPGRRTARSCRAAPATPAAPARCSRPTRRPPTARSSSPARPRASGRRCRARRRACAPRPTPSTSRVGEPPLHDGLVVRPLQLMMRTRTRRAAGFTLVELMTVVAIIGIVATLAGALLLAGVRGETAPAFARAVLSSVLDARHIGAHARAADVDHARRRPSGRIVTSAYDTTTSTWRAQSAMALPSTLQLCTPASSVQFGTVSPSCPFSTTNVVCFSPNGRVNMPASGTCATTSPSTGSGATIYCRDQGRGQEVSHRRLGADGHGQGDRHMVRRTRQRRRTRGMTLVEVMVALLVTTVGAARRARHRRCHGARRQLLAQRERGVGARAVEARAGGLAADGHHDRHAAGADHASRRRSTPTASRPPPAPTRARPRGRTVDAGLQRQVQVQVDWNDGIGTSALGRGLAHGGVCNEASHAARQRGFTLMEILVAMALTSIVTTSVLAIVRTQLERVRDERSDRAHAAERARRDGLRREHGAARLRRHQRRVGRAQRPRRDAGARALPALLRRRDRDATRRSPPARRTLPTRSRSSTPPAR